MTDPTAVTNGDTSPFINLPATSALVRGSVRSSQIVAPAIVAAMSPMIATRLTLNRITLMGQISLAPRHRWFPNP